MSTLSEKLEQGFAPPWRPDDDTAEGVHDNPLFGSFLRMESATTSFGPCWVMVLDQHAEGAPASGEEVAVWLLHTVLQNELARAKPKPGEELAIKYLGKQKPAGGGNPFHSYRVKVDRPTSEAFDWNKIGDGEFDEPVAAEPAASAQLGPDDELPEGF